MRLAKGDTLVEIMFAIGVFGLVSVGSIGIMNSGLRTAQGALEVSLARNEIDAQAEALRFIASATVSEIGRGSGPYTTIWQKIVSLAYTTDDAALTDADFFSGYSGASCSELYRNLPPKSFVVNTHALDSSLLADSSVLTNVIQSAGPTTSRNALIKTASTMPRLVFGQTLSDSSTLSDASAEGAVLENNLLSAEGIYITAVRQGISSLTSPEFYDFYIRTCWDNLSGTGSSTIETTVRLANPSIIASVNEG
ncbi:hypothetical protein IJH29_02290 [Candidatus Saccharibacteria bacterium]|nr:hypothetical protein [Candidatus Saccharibacteria bacterium]